ncbi:MAG: DUF4838 domain-containing protein [Anaerolineae bacterium]
MNARNVQMAVNLRSIILTPPDLSYPGWIPLIAEAGCNSLLVHAASACGIDALLAWYQGPEGQEIIAQCAKYGVSLDTQLHTGSWLLQRGLFASQPELFRADMNGQRTADVNFCFSSAAAWEITGERVKHLQHLLPAQTNHYLWLSDDIQDAVCHGPVCAPLSASDQALLFANRIAGLLRQVDPRAQVSYLAYQDTLACPGRVKPAAGVICEFAPIRRCYLHALDDPACAINREHVLQLARLRAFFEPAPLHITEYWLDASRFSGWKRPALKLTVSLDVMRRDIEFYRLTGATSIASYAVMCDADYWQRYGAPPVLEYGRLLHSKILREE